MIKLRHKTHIFNEKQLIAAEQPSPLVAQPHIEAINTEPETQSPSNKHLVQTEQFLPQLNAFSFFERKGHWYKGYLKSKCHLLYKQQVSEMKCSVFVENPLE